MSSCKGQSLDTVKDKDMIEFKEKHVSDKLKTWRFFPENSKDKTKGYSFRLALVPFLISASRVSEKVWATLVTCALPNVRFFQPF
jgi:hypothetical protein